MEENMQHFQHIMLYYFNKGKNATEMQKKKKSVQWMEKVLWLMESVKTNMQFRAGDFPLDDAPQSCSQVKMIAIKSRH